MFLSLGTGQDAGGPDRDRPLGKRGWVLLAVGMLLHAVNYILLNTPSSRVLRGDEVRYHAESISIAAGVFPPPDFLWPPLQKFFLGFVYAVFGDGRLPVAAIQTALFLASALLLRKLVLRLELGVGAADTAMALFLLDPQIGSFAFFLWPEVIHLFLVLAAAALLFSRRDDISWRDVGGGACLGLALLAKSLLGPFVLVVLAAIAVSAGGRPAGRRFVRAAAAGAGVLVIVIPVVAWNGLHHGYWGIARSGVFNLWVGLNDPPSRTDYDSTPAKAYWEYQGSGGTPGERDRATLVRIEKKTATDGLVTTLANQLSKQYVRLFDKNSFFTDMLAGGRFRPSEPPTAFARPARIWAWTVYGLTLALAGPGLFIGSRRAGARVPGLVLLFVLYNIAVFLFLHVKTRYRLPLLPCLEIYAGVTVSWAVTTWAKRRGPDPRGGQVPYGWLAGGTVLSASLLWLAFGGLNP